MKKLTIMSLVTAAAVTLSAGTAHADTDPRDYSGIVALPSQSAIVLAYYRHITSNDSTAIEQNLALLRATYVLKWGNFLLDPLDFILPVADATIHVPNPATGLSSTIYGAGLGDLIIVPTAVYEIPEGPSSSSFVGASSYVTAPTGNYDDTKLVNIGSNKWAFKQELMVGQKFAKRMTLEVIPSITFYTANDDFRTAPTEIHSLHQLPTEEIDVHYMADIAPYFGLGLSYYAVANGRAKLAFDDDATTTKQQTIQSVRVTGAIRVEKQSLLYLTFNQDIAASGGASISHFVGARISHFF